MPRKCPELEEVATALRQVLRRGLPLTARTVDPALLELQGVAARAADRSEPASLIAALEGVLRGLLARFPDARYAVAAQALFGLPPARRGENLTVRRKAAADACGHEVHHFRKRVEPRLVEQLAGELLADHDRFTGSPGIAPRLALARHRHTVPSDPLAWEVAEHEEALVRLWAAIYALRAELLGVERLLSLGDIQGAARHTVTAAWRWALATDKAERYAAAFADARPGQTSPHELVALAGWTPPLTSAQRDRLITAASGDADRAAFVRALHSDVELSHVWTGALLVPGPDPPKR